MKTFQMVICGIMFFAFILLATITAYENAAAQSFNVEIIEVKPPDACRTTGWVIHQRRFITLPDDMFGELTRYFVEYVNDDRVLAHYWGSGYSAYVQDYMLLGEGEFFVSASTGYDVPLWSDTYDAVTVEYTLEGDQVIWAIRTELMCENGVVTSYDITSQPADGTRESLPQPAPNLVLALDDIPRYGDQFNQTDYLGTIEACQTFYISDIIKPRASITVTALESITNQRIQWYHGPTALPIVDVAEDYGQPGGQLILDACVGA